MAKPRVFRAVIDEVARAQLMYSPEPLHVGGVKDIPFFPAQSNEPVDWVPEGLVEDERTF